MTEQTIIRDNAKDICQKIGQYFGPEYEVSSNNIDVFTIRSNLEHRAYIESQDIMIVNSIVSEFGLKIESWKILVANGQMGLYCVLKKPEDLEDHFS